MFGGKLEAGWGNVTDELWVFNILSRTWQKKNPVIGLPTQTQMYAVEGHSAHCVVLDGGEVLMLVIFGYSPIYSYISNVQEYNLSESLLTGLTKPFSFCFRSLCRLPFVSSTIRCLHKEHWHTPKPNYIFTL